MDRRYKNLRSWGGVRASDKGQRKADALVNAYLAKARRENRFANDYGGSTGGLKNASAGSGLQSLQNRSARQAELRKIFDEEGRGQFGARAASWEAKKDLYSDKPSSGTASTGTGTDLEKIQISQ
jgi:hypothetical protein